MNFALPLLGGLQIKSTWLASCFSFLAVWLFMVLEPVVTRRRIALLLAVLGGYAVVLGCDKACSILWRLPYGNRKCSYEVYPGKAVAEKAEELWAAHVPDRDRPLRYVIAPRKEGCSLSYYAAGHPHSCYFGDFRISPWCRQEELRRAGALVIWEVQPRRDGTLPKKEPGWLRRIPGNHELIAAGEFDFDRLTRPWFRRLCKKPIRKTRIAFMILPPEPVSEEPAR